MNKQKPNAEAQTDQIAVTNESTDSQHILYIT